MMKKILAVLFAALLVLALAACGGKKEDPEPSGTVGMANPWSDVSTAGEAAEGAGVGYFTLPDSGANVGTVTVNWSVFRWMTGLAEARGTVGNAELTIRKGLKENGTDVSGDYGTYEKEWTVDVGGVTVNCFGDKNGMTFKALWTTDNFSYSIFLRDDGATGLGADDTLALVSAVQ